VVPENFMATYQQRPNGNWSAKVRRKGLPTLSATFPTKAEAEAWGHQTESDITRKRIGNLDGEPLLRDVIGQYLKSVTPFKKGSDSESWRLKAIQRSWIGAYAVGKLTAKVVAQWRDERIAGASGRPVGSGTVIRELNLLHSVLEHARKEWNIGTETNPVSDVRRPKQPPSRDRIPTVKEKLTLLEACQASGSIYLPDVVELAFETAMRQGEIVSLRVEQVDLEGCCVSLKAGATKTDKARTVPLSSRAREILARVIGDRTTGRVWPGLTSEAVKRAFIRVREKAGIPDFRFHDTRHAATTRFVEMGLSDPEVMSITGHTSKSMMMRYTHLRAKDIAKKLG
jgi:integrase